MKKRGIIIILGVLILMGSFFIMKVISKKPEKVQKTFDASANRKTVETTILQPNTIATPIAVQGRVQAYEKADVVAEVTGVLKSSAKPLKVGQYFKKGELLMEIEDEETRLNLAAQKSALMNAITQLMPDLKIDHPESFGQWKNYLDNFDENAAIKPFPAAINEKEKYFISSRNLLSTYYTIKSAEERLQKFKVYAPFSGTLTEVLINKGAVVRGNQKVATLTNSNEYEMQASVPLSELPFIKIGDKVQLSATDMEGTWSGRINRLSTQVDPQTQTVIAYVRLSGKEIREGLYLRGAVSGKTIQDAFEISRNLVIDQSAIYVLKDSVLALQAIELVKFEGDKAIVKGIPDSSLVIAKPVVGAYEGMIVKHNTVSN